MENQKSKVIEAMHLNKQFNEIIAVNDVSFNVNKGEIFGFLGPNGAGKTTTIRMITGLITPDSGDISIDGIDIKKHPIKAKTKIGVIPENGNIYIDLTAKQNIFLAGKFYGIPKKELKKITDYLLDKFELYERKNHIVKTFSKGMKQRINIASAIVHNPEILFLDEPTSGLDVKSQRLIKNIIKEMNYKGTTIFLTTHNIEEANLMCDRVGIINKGRIAAIDSPENLKKIFEETQSVEVSFDKPIDIDIIKQINNVDNVEKKGDKWKLYTKNPDEIVKSLSKILNNYGLKFDSLNIKSESLEDAFIKLTEKKHDK